MIATNRFYAMEYKSCIVSVLHAHIIFLIGKSSQLELADYLRPLFLRFRLFVQPILLIGYVVVEFFFNVFIHWKSFASVKSVIVGWYFCRFFLRMHFVCFWWWYFNLALFSDAQNKSRPSTITNEKRKNEKYKRNSRMRCRVGNNKMHIQRNFCVSFDHFDCNFLHSQYRCRSIAFRLMRFRSYHFHIAIVTTLRWQINKICQCNERNG